MNINKTKNYDFYIIENDSEKYQVIVKSKLNRSVSLRDIVCVKGNLQESLSNKFTYEINGSELEILSKNQKGLPYPYERKKWGTIDYNHRSYQLSDPEAKEYFKKKSNFLHNIRNYLQNNTFMEVNSPTIVGDHVQSKTNSFNLDFYGKDANLKISNIIYHQILISSDFDRVYEIDKLFRKNDKPRKSRLDEFQVLDITQSYTNKNQFIYLFEGLIKSTAPEREFTFDKITYDDVLSMLNKKGHIVNWGESHQINQGLMNDIRKYVNTDFFWVMNYPLKSKAFFNKTFTKDEKDYCHSFELWGNIFSNIASGGERVINSDELIANIEKKGLNKNNFENYINSLACGSPPSCGIGMGVDIMFCELMKDDDIKKSNLFPVLSKRRLL